MPAEVLVTDAVPGQWYVFALTAHNPGLAAARLTLTADPPLTLALTALEVPAQGSASIKLTALAASYQPEVVALRWESGDRAGLTEVTLAPNPDRDGDGHALPEAGGDDCDDERPLIHPGADERCDGRDDDCDGVADESAVDAPVWRLDLDGDGYAGWEVVRACEAPARAASRTGDCDDTDPSVSPGAAEIWYDGVDQDCDGRSDLDQDRDGVPVTRDCDDTDSAVFPGASELWYDGVDQACDGGSDFDQDGDGVPLGLDCSDVDASVAPGLPERWGDGRDNDCDGLVDEAPPLWGELLFTELGAQEGGLLYAEVCALALTPVELDGVLLDTLQLSGVLLPGGCVLVCGPTEALDCAGEVDPATRELTLWDAEGALLDAVRWDGWPLTEGAALELGTLDPDQNDRPEGWCPALEESAPLLGSPGALGPGCP
ncbi:MAG: putative metal-binding motif-containing protein [Deltaproteobacteria bacterium]|nr:putative metal-binding motif-containing protein [Deltaproteobacteria bacterium]